MPLTIAIDGPVGAGKSTISDEVAKRLGILHLDTGAMYRAVGVAVMENGIDPRDEESVCRFCEEGKAVVDVRYEKGAQITLLNGKDVTFHYFKEYHRNVKIVQNQHKLVKRRHKGNS